MAQDSFKHQLKTGVFYTALAKYSGIIISLGVTAVLSRLLTPADFGVIAVASVIIVFFNVFSDMGLGSAIIQKKDLTSNDYNSLFSYTVYSGLILAGIFFGVSWIVADIYEDKRLIVLCQVLSAQILFGTWNIVPNGLLVRDKMFKFIGIRTIVVQLCLAGLSIGAVFLGFGVYTLLINPVGGAIFSFIINFKNRPAKFKLKPNISSVKKVAKYSGYSFGFTLINYFSRNLDTLLIGRVFGLSPLGYYEKSYRLMLLPVQNLTNVITPVLHPILADFQHNIKEQWIKYSKLLRLLAMIGFPLTAFLFFTAKDLILIVYGDQWIPAIPVFQILSLTVGFQIIGSTVGSFYMACNKPNLLFYIGIINTIINVGGLFVGIYAIKSIEGVAWMWVASTFLIQYSYYFMAKAVNISIWEIFKIYVPSLIVTMICVLCFTPFSIFFHISLVGDLFIKLGLFIFIMIPSLQFTKTIDIFGITNRYIQKIFNLNYCISK